MGCVKYNLYYVENLMDFLRINIMTKLIDNVSI